jgi:hypothetical protein
MLCRQQQQRQLKKPYKSTVAPDQEDAAPFDHEEENPQPMDMEIMEHDEWNEEQCSFTDDDDDVNYDATSMTTEPDLDLSSSLQGSPVFKSYGKSVFVEPASPPGVPIGLDDDSWIV